MYNRLYGDLYMVENNEDLLKLFDRITDGQASDEDISEYNRWCHSLQAKNLPVPDMEKITAEMLQKIREQIHDTSKTYRLQLWVKIAAAACIALLLAIGGHYIIQTPKSGPIAQTRSQDVAPGGNKAVLTLANGQTIILDNAHAGQLTSQGNSKITKVNNGLIAYQPGTSTGSGPAAMQYNTLAVPRGGQYQLILPDGTKVWLNAASSIRYPAAFTGTERRVAITGEAYMEVAKDVNRPFIVTTRHSDITVLGTRFNVMAYSNEPVVNTTLLEGSIKVSLPGEKQSIMIEPGEQASVGNTSSDIQVNKVNADDAAAWIHGLLSLNDVSVQEFMDQLSRWYDVDIEYAGKVPPKKFGGMINRNAHLSDVLSALNVAGIHTKLEGKKIIVLSE
jgi:ferric-dicitrate binding protein FerR (iron transport regulator)